MTFEERVRALALLGFSERQTRFLVTVALHGGFCLRRQYMAFAGLRYGAGVRDFLDRLVRHKLATRCDFRRDRGHVYHLHASAIYDAIGQPDNRNRRTASAALIARKFMVLDYVVAHPHLDWFATEEDKVALFGDHFGVPRLDLPQRIYVAARRETPPTTRYFIHKLPIFVHGEPTVVSFVWLMTDVSGDAFEQFVHDHVQLLSHLPQWRIVAVAPRHIPGLPACGPALDRVVVAVGRPRPAPAPRQRGERPPVLSPSVTGALPRRQPVPCQGVALPVAQVITGTRTRTSQRALILCVASWPSRERVSGCAWVPSRLGAVRRPLRGRGLDRTRAQPGSALA